MSVLTVNLESVNPSLEIEAMKRSVQPYSYQNPNKPGQPKPEWWKDGSVLGCVVSGILLIFIVYALLSPEHGIPKVHKVQRIKHQLENEIAYLQEENTRLQYKIEAMKTDPFGLEKLAREELNMGLPGEIVYKFPE